MNMSSDDFVDENSLTFLDGETCIDYVLVYTKSHSTSVEKNDAIAKIREKFIEILIKKHKVEIQEVFL
jgi:hypothetical protein